MMEYCDRDEKRGMKRVLGEAGMGRDRPYLDSLTGMPRTRQMAESVHTMLPVFGK